MIDEMDQMPSETGKLSVRTYIDTFMMPRKTAGCGEEIARSNKRQQP